MMAGAVMAGVSRLVVCLLVAGVHAAGASGGMPATGTIVHDPVSYIQHVRSVQAALVAEAQRARQIQQQWESLLLQERQPFLLLRLLRRRRRRHLTTTHSSQPLSLLLRVLLLLLSLLRPLLLLLQRRRTLPTC